MVIVGAPLSDWFFYHINFSQNKGWEHKSTQESHNNTQTDYF